MEKSPGGVRESFLKTSCDPASGLGEQRIKEDKRGGDTKPFLEEPTDEAGGTSLCLLHTHVTI
jgi:hypothetical protein